jgi:hypothetical protein
MRYFVLVSVLLLSAASLSVAQSSGLRVTSPLPNHEIRLGDSVPVSYSIVNQDNVARTMAVHVEIQNVVTGIQTYEAFDTVILLGSNISFSKTLLSYKTNSTNLSQLGTFYLSATLIALDASRIPIPAWPFRQTIIQRLFGVRRTDLNQGDPSNNYGKTAFGRIPDVTTWASCGATISEGDSETWDPPSPRDDINGYGADKLHAPLIRLDRADEQGNLYTGSNVGDTMTTFPINSGQLRTVIKFNFMRGSKVLYPALWQQKMVLGPEQTILSTTGAVEQRGDSLVLEYRDPSDNAYNPARWTEIAAIDGGHDLEFQNFWMVVNTSDSSARIRINGRNERKIFLSPNYLLDSNFRMRLRLKANNASGPSADDGDPWYIDNVLIERENKPDIQTMWARVVTPFTKIPISAASALPVYLRVWNYEDYGLPPLGVFIQNRFGDTVYNSSRIATIDEGVDTIIRFPDWDARNVVGQGPFRVTGWSSPTYNYHFHDDNENYSTFYLNVDRDQSEFAYDDAGMQPAREGGNDVPFIVGSKGRGLGSLQGSGSYAMKFVLTSRDTLKGANVYFASANAGDDAIRISVFQDNPDKCTPGDTVQLQDVQSVFAARRMGGFFDNFWPYYFPKPIVLEPGTYWLSVSQLSLSSMMLGGDASRGGAQLRVDDPLSPQNVPIYSNPYGTQWSADHNNGDVSCAFAKESTAGSGSWEPFMPPSGNWPESAARFMPGTFIPMIRAIMGSGAPSSSVASVSTNELLFASYPNPFTPGSGYVDLNFVLPSSTQTTLIIYDEMGREVRTLLSGRWEQGQHTEHWDGRDAGGKLVASGMYVCRLSGERESSVKILVVR